MVSIILIISLLLFFIYAALIIYYRLAWQSIPSFNAINEIKTPVTKLTVIVPARNEANNIGDCLKCITNQNYPANLLQVIVVDDHSTDDTAMVVQSFRDKKVELISLKDFITIDINSYKKKAIEIAITKSTGELIITTDADCFMGNKWLATIATFYEKYKPAFIAAPVSIDCSSRFLEMFQAVDFMTLQGITGASVHKKIHSMCNGANLAYEKKAFEEVNGFDGIDTIASGDDMLLMHKIYNRYPHRVMFLKSAAAIVYTQPANTLKSFINQRIRWASKADKYDDKSILPVLVTVYFFNVMLLLLPLISIFNHSTFSFLNFSFSLIGYWMMLVILKTAIELFFLFPVARFFHKQMLLWLFPIMQPFHILYTVVAGWLGKFGTYNWKERKVK